MNALLKVRILDPACGSGAFPMGMLQQMVHILRQIDHDNKAWKVLLKKRAGQLADKAYQETDDNEERKRRLEEIENAFNSRYANPDYARKLFIIQNCIYGVDIQPIAMQISKLRFFISLICEQNNSIMPLPNLETKFVCANTLIGINKGDGVLRSDDLETKKQELLEVRKQHFYARTACDKKKYRAWDGEIRADLEKMIADLEGFDIGEAKQLVAWNPYDQNASSPFFDAEWMFGITDGFDIVIGNPPYISSADQNKDKILKEQRKRLSKDKRYTTLFEKWDLYIAFLELSSRYLINEQGVCCMIVPYPFTNQKYGLKLRKMFIEDKNLFRLVDLNGIKVFDAAVFNCIPFVSNSHTLNKTMIAKGEKDENNNLSIYDSFEQPHDKLIQDAKTQVWNLTQDKRETSRHADMHVLGDYCYVSKGMVLYSEEGLFTNEDLISETKDAIHCREYLEAKDMDRYLINQIRFVEYNTERVPLMVSRPTFQELYDKPKLLFNCLGEMKVMVDLDQQFICQQGIRVAVPWINLNGVKNRSITSVIRKYSTLERSQMEALSKTVNLYYLLGVLNSRYASVLLTNIRGGDYHIVPEHIRNIPIPSATKEQQQPIIDLVNQILAAKKTNPQADTTALERKIDILVYLLYGLTWEEVQIVENSLL